MRSSCAARNREQNERLVETGARMRLGGVLHVQARGWAHQKAQSTRDTQHAVSVGAMLRGNTQDGIDTVQSDERADQEGPSGSAAIEAGALGEQSSSIPVSEVGDESIGHATRGRGAGYVKHPQQAKDLACMEEELMERRAHLLAKRCDGIRLFDR